MPPSAPANHNLPATNTSFSAPALFPNLSFSSPLEACAGPPSGLGRERFNAGESDSHTPFAPKHRILLHDDSKKLHQLDPKGSGSGITGPESRNDAEQGGGGNLGEEIGGVGAR